MTTEPEHRDWDGVLWRALVESSPDVILVVDLEGTVLFVNHVRPPFEGHAVVGAKIWEFSPEGGRERVLAMLARVADTRETVVNEAPGFRADGGVGWYEARMFPLVIDGNVERVLFCGRDITERKAAVEKLEASERRFRALVEHGSDCIVLIDAEGLVSYVSPAVCRALGYEAHELLARPALDCIHPDDREVAHRAGRGSSPGSCVASTIRVRHKDGSWRVHEGTSTNLLHDPAVRAVVSNRHDVTDRKLEEERVAFQAHVLAQVSEPVVVADRHGAITYWNEAATRVFGYTADEALGKVGGELLQARYPGGFDAMVASIRRTQSWRGELELRTKNGEPMVVETSVRQQPGTLAGITVMKDVTERRSLEEQLRQSQKMEAIGLLAGGVAHDFNNLLAVIMGFSELATRKLPPGHPVALQLDEVIGAARRGGELTRKLLAFSRKQIIQPRPLDVGAAVGDFTRLLERVVGEDIELAIEREPEALVVRADAVQLEQVLLNLCTNARQAMPEGGRLVLSTRPVFFDDAFVARNPWSRPGAFAEIAVRDTGVGMDDATRTRIFEPFFTTKPEGTGLGLSTVYGIAAQHGGFVHVESSPGGGTTLRVFLPQADVSASSLEIRGAPRSEPGARGHESILLAEDEPALRSLVTTTLNELGYRVIATGDGEEAVREYERQSGDIDLVVLDVVLPRLDARQAYERMRVIRPDVKVLFTTGYAPESTRMGELLEGARIPLLEKPFTPAALAARVRSAIDG